MKLSTIYNKLLIESLDLKTIEKIYRYKPEINKAKWLFGYFNINTETDKKTLFNVINEFKNKIEVAKQNLKDLEGNESEIANKFRLELEKFINITQMGVDLHEKQINEDANDENTNYLIKPTYQFLVNIIKTLHIIEPKPKTRLEILKERKNELKLNEFENLFNYYNFCNINDFVFLNNPIKNYKSTISSWVWYLCLLQLFPNELKNAGNKRDVYTNQYKEILSMPKLTGNLEEDKKIMEIVIRNHMFESYSPVRNATILYNILFGDKENKTPRVF